MKKRIFTIFGSGLIIGALFFGGNAAYSIVQEIVGISGCDNSISAFTCAWRNLSSLSSTEAVSNNAVFPKGASVEHALMTGALLYGKNGNATDWRPLVTNPPENSSTTGVLANRIFYQDVTIGNIFSQRNARDSDTSDGLGTGSALTVFQDGTPAGFDDWQGLRSTRRIGATNDGSNIPAMGNYLFDGTNWDSQISVIGAVDGVTGDGITASGGYGFNGTNWDRFRTADATTLTDTVSVGIPLSTPLSTWIEFDNPLANILASASKAAGAAGVRHVVTSISGCLASNGGAAPIVNLILRDGATGAGSIIWGNVIGVQSLVGETKCFALSGLAITGTAATAMTLEFNVAPGANNFESVDLTGYSVQ